MRWLINYIRSMFCKHKWEYIAETINYDWLSGDTPAGYTKIYRCKKCGYTQKINY